MQQHLLAACANTAHHSKKFCPLRYIAVHTAGNHQYADMAAVYMMRDAYISIMEQNHLPINPSCYIQFQDVSKASGIITEIRQQYDLPTQGAH